MKRPSNIRNPLKGILTLILSGSFGWRFIIFHLLRGHRLFTFSSFLLAPEAVVAFFFLLAEAGAFPCCAVESKGTDFFPFKVFSSVTFNFLSFLALRSGEAGSFLGVVFFVLVAPFLLEAFWFFRIHNFNFLS